MPTRLSRSLFIAVLLTLACAGCGRYNMEQVRETLYDGDVNGAMVSLDKMDSQAGKLPYLFERGLVAHYADQLDESNRAFELAEIISEDLYTKSISKELASLVTSDNIRPYSGTRYERLMVHYYRALNYAYQNQPDEALVECRRAGRLLQAYVDEDPSYNFIGAAFIAYLSGILYESTGDWNDAYISYRWAERAYGHYQQELGVAMPSDVGHSLVRLARRLGFGDDAEKYVERYGEPPAIAPQSGELVLFYETGFVPQREEENIVFPIFKTDSFDKEDEVWDFTGKLAKRRNIRYDESQLEYLLRVAIPRYGSDAPRFLGVQASVGQQTARGVIAEHVERAAQTTFVAEQGTILLRTVARGLLKYLAYRRANKEGRLAGLLMNALNVATERADTRAWETLPNQIHMVRMWLPPGEQDVQLNFLNGKGYQVGSHTLTGIQIRAGRKTILNHRTFE